MSIFLEGGGVGCWESHRRLFPDLNFTGVSELDIWDAHTHILTHAHTYTGTQRVLQTHTHTHTHLFPFIQGQC